MIECYYSDCKHHSKDEPFCGLSDVKKGCIALKEEIVIFEETRRKYLKELPKAKYK